MASTIIGGLPLERLNDHNYLTWSVKMQFFLVKEGLWEAVENPPAQPGRGQKIAAQKAHSWIVWGVEESQLNHIRHLQTAKECWEALRGIHIRTTATSKMALSRKLYRARLEPEGDVLQHLQHMQQLFIELSEKGRFFEESDKVFIVLSSLDDSWDNFSQSLEVLPEKDLTMHYLTGRLLEEEAKRKERRVEQAASKQHFKNSSAQPQSFCLNLSKAYEKVVGYPDVSMGKKKAKNPKVNSAREKDVCPDIVIGKKKAKGSKAKKSSKECAGAVSSSAENLAKKYGRKVEKIPSEQELQCFVRQISELILKNLPKAEVSLLNGYVESECILIDGDALFITCAHDSTLQQGQNLHFFYLVECFLLNLTSKGIKYILVFFKDAELLYHGNPYLLFLRTALIHHLIKNTDIAVKTEFYNCLEDNWKRFLNNNSPYFLLTSVEGLNQLQTNFFHIIIIHTLFKNINVVLISGYEFDTEGIYGFRIHTGQHHWKFFGEHESEIRMYLENEGEHLKASDAESFISFFGCLSLEDVDEKIIHKMSLIPEEEEDIRYIVCIVSWSLVLNMYNKEQQSKTATAKQNSPLLTLQETADLIRMYCLSVAFLYYLPLSERAQIKLIRNNWNEETNMLIHQHKFCEFHVLKNLDCKTSLDIDTSTLPDLSDNLLWRNIVHYYESGKGPELDLDIKSNIHLHLMYEKLWKGISRLSARLDIGASFPLRKTSKCFLTPEFSPNKGNASNMTLPKLELIPMECTLMDEFAGDILNDLSIFKSDTVTVQTKWRKHIECQSWYSRRPLSEDCAGTAAKELWALQNCPQWQISPCTYGTLEEFTTSKMTDTVLCNSNKNYTDIKKSKEEHKAKSNIAALDEQKKKCEEQKKGESNMKDLSVPVERNVQEICSSGINMEPTVDKSVQCAVKMAELNSSLDMWKKHCDSAGQFHKNLNLAVDIMRRVHLLIENYQNVLKEDDFQQIVRCFQYLGFDNLITTSEYTKVPEKKDEFKKKFSIYAVGIGSARFQLQCMSQYLMQEERKEPDPRVQHFIPDSWQREILDIVDKNESAVIIAPTSSGKSEASYYCIEKILRDGDEGVIVYVAPTQAVINQVKATIDSRFNRIFPDGQFLCGVLTQGYRHVVLDCQILVTTPQCFEVLLLLPHHQDWVRRMRYVILDEICYHGAEVASKLWEHILLMIQCPFLVLSAMISNSEHLIEWLQSIKNYWRKLAKVVQTPGSSTSKTNDKKAAKERNKFYRVRLVLHKERYNDLEKYVCLVKENYFIIYHYHPYSALTVDEIERYGFPEDLVLSPHETVELYDIMVNVWKKWPRAVELDPENFTRFKDNAVIRKVDARYYEQELKDELELWIEDGHKHQAAEVLKLLKPHGESCSETQMKELFPYFVEKLQEMDKLPALFFIFNIRIAEELAKKVCCFLEEKQMLIGEVSSSKNQGHLLATKTEPADKLTETKQASIMQIYCEDKEKLIKKVKPGNVRKQFEQISGISGDCTSVNYQAVGIEALHKILNHARFTTTGELQKLALRGIGYHHAFMEYKEKQLVEMLFKIGFIQVLTSTGTLALGINTPCKSVVFVQDSEYLDPLAYRWMSGRTGQRGHHSAGNVFFYNIPFSKIESLMKSKKSHIQGQFLLRTSLILRLMLFASKADDKTSAKKQVMSLLKNSLLSFEEPWTLKMLKLYFIFSLQFLVKEGYVDRKGSAMGFPGLVNQLNYHEPSNFVFATFLVRGLFCSVCLPIHKGTKVFSEAVMENLVVVLAHLFGRKYMPAAVVGSKQKFSRSKVFLEELPKDFAATLDKYNHKVEESFGQFLLTASTVANRKRYQLPLSKLDFSNKEQYDHPLAFHIMKCDKERTAISPFVCLSGNSDLELLHAGSLNNVLLHILGITVSNIPVLYLKKCDNQGRRMPLNAYLLDFYRHGSLKAICQDNGLHEGEAFRSLKDFAHSIQTISISLREFCSSEDRNVVWAFEQLAKSYWKKLEGIEEEGRK